MGSNQSKLAKTILVDNKLPNSHQSSCEKIHTAAKQRLYIEDLIVIWLDTTSLMVGKDLRDFRSLTSLQETMSFLETFTDIEVCWNFIQTIKNEKVFLILSLENELDTENLVLSRFHDLSQVDLIYIINDHNQETITHLWRTKYRKLKGIFTDIDSICTRLQTTDIQMSELSNMTPISVLSCCTQIGGPFNGEKKVDLNSLDKSFKFSQIIKEFVIRRAYNMEESFKALIDFCSEQYAKNPVVLEKVKKLSQYYVLAFPHHLYASKGFFYRMLNHAFRTEDTQVAYKTGVLIKALYLAIQSLPKPCMSVVYRGQAISKNELKKMENNIGGLLVFNNFFIATQSRDVALNDASAFLDNFQLNAVIFQINLDPLIQNTTQYITIDLFAVMGRDTNDEILFSMQTMFLIEKIERLDSGVWCIDLKLISNDDKQIKRLTQYMRFGTQYLPYCQKELTKEPPLEWNEKKKVLEMLIKQSEQIDEENVISLYECLGLCYENNNDLDGAFQHYTKSLELCLLYTSDDKEHLINIHSKIGTVLRKKGEFQCALEHYQFVFNIQWNILPRDEEEIARTEINIGRILSKLNRNDEAMINLNRALKAVIDEFPCSYFFHQAAKYNALGYYYEDCGAYTQAYQYHATSFMIKQLWLPSIHVSLVISHTNLARTLEHMQKYLEAIEHAKQAVKIACHLFPRNTFRQRKYKDYLQKLLEDHHEMQT